MAAAAFAFEGFPGRTLRAALFTDVANGGCVARRASRRPSRPAPLVRRALMPCRVRAPQRAAREDCGGRAAARGGVRQCRHGAQRLRAAPRRAQGAGGSGGGATHHAHAAQRPGVQSVAHQQRTWPARAAPRVRASGAIRSYAAAARAHFLFRSPSRSSASASARRRACCWWRASTAARRRCDAAGGARLRRAAALTQPLPQLEAACAHVTGTRQPLALLESLLDADALTKAREAAPAQRASAADAPLRLGGADCEAHARRAGMRHADRCAGVPHRRQGGGLAYRPQRA